MSDWGFQNVKLHGRITKSCHEICILLGAVRRMQHIYDSGYLLLPEDLQVQGTPTVHLEAP